MSLEFHSKIDIVKTVNVKITASGFEEGANVKLTYTPEHILDNNNLDGDKRWCVFGPVHWLDFQFDQQLTVYGVDIAWYKGNEYRETFEILSSTTPEILWKGMSSPNSNFELYRFKEELVTRNIRILCRGNTIDQWNRITAVKFRLGPIPENEWGPSPFPDCPEGQHWHEALQTCVSDVITKPPVIKIREPLQTVRHGDGVTIDGSQTTDPVGSNMFYEWTQIGGETVNTSNKLEPNIVFKTPTVDTEMVFRLKVTNSANLSSTADAKVVVRAAIPQCPPGELWDEKTKRCVGIHQPEPVVKKKLPKKKNRR